MNRDRFQPNQSIVLFNTQEFVERRTFISYIKAERLERFRAGVALAWRCARVEEAREARANLPDHHDTLFQGCRHQSAPVGRKAARSQAALVALEDVEARGGLEVVHDDGTLVSPYGKTLTGHVEIDGRISVGAHHPSRHQ